MIEAHHDPDNAYSDGAQSLTLEQFAALMQELKELENVIYKTQIVN